MQHLSKKYLSAFIFSTAIIFISVLLRIILMITGFDYSTLFYSNNLLPTILYFFVLASSTVIFLQTKSVKITKLKRGMPECVLSLFSAIIMIGLLIVKLMSAEPMTLIAKVSHNGAVIALVFSCIFYITDAFRTRQKAPSSILVLLNVAPLLYLIFELIDCFTAISIKANSYYLFPNVISILVLAFYILYSGKLNIVSSEDEGIPMLSYACLSTVFLSFSVVPDIVLMLIGNLEFSMTDILLSVLKIIYTALSIITVTRMTKGEAEDK